MSQSLDTAEKVLKYVVRNQVVDKLDRNYVSEISRELGLNRETVSDKIKHYESLGILKRKRDGKRKQVVVNQGVIDRIDFKGDDELAYDKPNYS